MWTGPITEIQAQQDVGLFCYRENTERKSHRGIGYATNNIAEMSAVVLGIEALKKPEESEVTLYTDSQYVQGLLSLGWRGTANLELVNHARSLVGQLKKFQTNQNRWSFWSERT